MGCDIHMCIEYKPYTDCNWRSLAVDFPGDRHYGVFEALAGVRGEDANAVVPPRGLPEDMSWPICEMFGKEQARLEFLNGDHSASWLDAGEVEKALAKTGISDEIEGNNTWIIVRRLFKDLAKMFGEKNVRLVFNFDN